MLVMTHPYPYSWIDLNQSTSGEAMQWEDDTTEPFSSFQTAQPLQTPPPLEEHKEESSLLHSLLEVGQTTAQTTELVSKREEAVPSSEYVSTESTVQTGELIHLSGKSTSNIQPKYQISPKFPTPVVAQIDSSSLRTQPIKTELTDFSLPFSLNTTITAEDKHLPPATKMLASTSSPSPIELNIQPSSIAGKPGIQATTGCLGAFLQCSAIWHIPSTSSTETGLLQMPADTRSFEFGDTFASEPSCQAVPSTSTHYQSSSSRQEQTKPVRFEAATISPTSTLSVEPSTPQLMRPAKCSSSTSTLSPGSQTSSKSVPEKRRFLCQYPECSKRFTRPDELKRHFRIHTGDRPFACEYCCRSFGRSDHLRTHTRSHTGERPYVCEQCGRRFARSDERARHRKLRGCGLSSALPQMISRSSYPRRLDSASSSGSTSEAAPADRRLSQPTPAPPTEVFPDLTRCTSYPELGQISGASQSMSSIQYLPRITWSEQLSTSEEGTSELSLESFGTIRQIKPDPR